MEDERMRDAKMRGCEDVREDAQFVWRQGKATATCRGMYLTSCSGYLYIPGQYGTQCAAPALL